MVEPKAPGEWLNDITVGDDGLRPVRKARPWSRDKLGILAMYLPAFARASKTANDFYFVDGLAGEGLYEFDGPNEYVLGSTLIALSTQPQFARVVSMELSASKCDALARRTEKYGRRSVVRQGNCNEDLVPLMEDCVPRQAPTLVLLDPEGLELEWRTIERLAQFRTGGRKVELLVLVPTGSVGRVAQVAHDSTEEGANRIDFMFPYPSRWHDVWQQRRERRITAEQSRHEFAEIYRKGLEELGYSHTLIRPITQAGADDASVYHLVFASDHPAGRKIMEHNFREMFSNPKPSPRKVNPAQGSLW